MFNTKGTVYYTSPEPEYQYSVYERRAGKCPFTDEDLVPIISTEGAAESALSFDGTDDYVDLSNPSELKITGNQTIEIWLKPMSLSNRQSIFCKAYNGEGAITLEVDGKLSYYYGTSGDNPSGTSINPDTFQGILSNFGLVRNEWSHIAIVRDFSSRKLSWYIDGTAAGTEIITKEAATAGTENVFLGKGYADNFNGSIDEVRIWNRARSADEIKEDRHHRLVGREPGLVGYWRFDENTGTTVYDQTDSANNGTISGATWEKSDALIGSHPGMSRDSFSFNDRTIASGLTAVQYFQQEDAQVGNGQENKPMKTNARVMLAVATGGAGADGSTTTNKYVAALDLAISREGKLAQVPDNLSLSWLNRTDLDGESLESSFAQVERLETDVRQLKKDIQKLQGDIQSIEGSAQTLTEAREQKDRLLNQLGTLGTRKGLSNTIIMQYANLIAETPVTTTNSGTTSGTTSGTGSGTTSGTGSGTTSGTTSGTGSGTTSGTGSGTTSGTGSGTTSGTGSTTQQTELEAVAQAVAQATRQAVLNNARPEGLAEVIAEAAGQVVRDNGGDYRAARQGIRQAVLDAGGDPTTAQRAPQILLEAVGQIAGQRAAQATREAGGDSTAAAQAARDAARQAVLEAGGDQAAADAAGTAAEQAVLGQ